MILRSLRLYSLFSKNLKNIRLFQTEVASNESKICSSLSLTSVVGSNISTHHEHTPFELTNKRLGILYPVKSNILDIPVPKTSGIVPFKINNVIIRDILPVLNDFDCPTSGNVVEKKAERMIIQRRRKMRKHQLKKWRKKFKFAIRKRRHRLELRKEKEFQAALLKQIKEADEFNPEKYITEKLTKAANVPKFEKWRRPPVTSNIIFHPLIPETFSKK